MLTIRHTFGHTLVLFLFFWGGRLQADPAVGLPTIEIRTSGVVITQSCRIFIPPGTILSDPADAGAIQIGASDITIAFAPGSVLRGSPREKHPDDYRGYGIRVNRHTGVIIRDAQISGFWCGLWASQADDLLLEGIDASDTRRARLKSTPAAEDESDWLYGHDNDQHEWLSRYGAAFYIEKSARVIVRDCRVRHGQNGLCLDRVKGSKIYDNDFSFDSGWGIALWRCSSNIISRNALDFCVRGYSHGVYNRGQDSAGIFAFEQNNGNVIAENSVTHGGDGFFGFAGREALGETGNHPVSWYKGRGNSDNLLIHNDFSDAAAHGIENTFSFGNRYLENRIVDNAICGIWAGYSRQTLIAGNQIAQNGEMGYGLERGGVNIDHGGDNTIVYNTFATNRCGVHLWGGANSEFEKKNWAKANGYASTGSVIADNIFHGDSIAFQFRGPGSVTLGSNDLNEVSRELLAEPAYDVTRNDQLTIAKPNAPRFTVFGSTHPVGARENLRGRQNIIMTEWGPWDHTSPLVRLLKSSGGVAVYQVLKVPRSRIHLETLGEGVTSRIEPISDIGDESQVLVRAAEPGVRPFELRVNAGPARLADLSGILVAAQWQVTFFKWPTDLDPRKNLAGYRELAKGPTAVSDVVDQLSFRYGMRGPSDLGLSEKITATRLGRDHFGMIARTQLPLDRGTWQVTTESDDGVRVTVDGKPVIENWTWHGPTRDTGIFSLETRKTVELVVEHFQIDGYAVLDFSIAPSAPQPGRPTHQ